MEKGFTIPVLDKGFCKYEGSYGDDSMIPRIARVSTGSENKGEELDKKLLSYLYKNFHSSPFEFANITFLLKCPLFVRDQIVRHRTAKCLSGDTLLYFDLPSRKGKFKSYKIRLEDFVDKWNNGARPILRQNNRKKIDIQKVDSSQKYSPSELAKITNRSSEAIRTWASKNGIFKYFINEREYLILGSDFINWYNSPQRLQRMPMKGVLGKMQLRFYNEETREIEHCNIIDAVEQGEKEIYQIETEGGYKIKTTLDHKFLGEDGWSEIGALLEIKKTDKSVSFFPKKIACNGIPLYQNYEWLRAQREKGLGVQAIGGDLKNFFTQFPNFITEINGKKKIHTPQKLSVKFNTVKSVKFIGKETVYDISVNNKFHNFIANGIVVHNCNIMSLRYQEAEDEFYHPEKWRLQDTKNRQSSNETDKKIILNTAQWNDDYERGGDKTDIDFAFGDVSNHAYHTYEKMIEQGVAKEMARMVLGTNLYTYMYIQFDLNNLIKFFRLRSHPHAQWEVRQYSDSMYSIFKELFPQCAECYEKFKMEVKESQ